MAFPVVNRSLMLVEALESTYEVCVGAFDGSDLFSGHKDYSCVIIVCMMDSAAA